MNDPLAVERCIVELQRGREAVLSHTSGSCVVTLVETVTPSLLQAINAAGSCQLIVSANRARALGRETDDEAAVLQLLPHTSLQSILKLAGLHTLERNFPDAAQWQSDEHEAAIAGLRLAQQSHALPALLLYPHPVGPGSILSCTVTDALSARPDTGDLMAMSKTRIPLSDAASVELAVFKERHGSAEHVAITVGEPDLGKPVDVRIHSSCFTGDILGSLRCDCGEQLNGAISSMARTGGGLILYLSQEGRGIGLASKLRAYQLQDEGLDTIEANQNLGFGDDERRYQAATTILNELGVSRIRLITNNPLKIESLRREGIDVIDRLPSHATVNEHNARYLQTKRDRAGHLCNIESAV
ncbi:GTP cyclohydrolase II [Granulosicoccus antarcticus]|uniref:GTP cyclohydrolase-2 n=1 Tax=Granulosicoccus antarcticus IMCC3135 TaxID=1192854 RepID=A0A2Z2NU70_9GAMM|nr:GTP cyclohydrolase II [Granulosicoccus antarcticus]ASJ71197.1 GTP cyclohydrolase-2 [Granulosicoccus antarcticus IMCC3135]